MNVKCPCQHCKTNLEFDTADAGQTVACPQCGMDTVLFLPPTPQPAKIKPFETVPAHSPPRKVSEHEKLRRKSAYRLGRILVNLLFWASVIAVPITFFNFLSENAMAESGGVQAWSEHHIAAQTDFIYFLASVGNCLFTFLLREVVAAIFDMADCALLNRKENSN